MKTYLLVTVLESGWLHVTRRDAGFCVEDLGWLPGWSSLCEWLPWVSETIRVRAVRPSPKPGINFTGDMVADR